MTSSAATTSAPAPPSSVLGKRPNQETNGKPDLTDDEQPITKRPRHMPIKRLGGDYISTKILHPKTVIVIDLPDYEKLIASEKLLKEKTATLENELHKIEEANLGLLKQIKEKEPSKSHMADLESAINNTKLLEKTKESQVATINDLKKQINWKNTSIDSMRKSNENLNKKNEILQKENDELKKDLEKAKTTIQTQQKKLVALVNLD